MDAISRDALGLKRPSEVGWEGFTRFREPASWGLGGAPDRGRTCNLQLRRLTLYPIELRALQRRRVIAQRPALVTHRPWHGTSGRPPTTGSRPRGPSVRG